MTKFPWTCRPDVTLDEPARIMREHGCGCVPVTRDDRFGRLVGIVTDRDICMAALERGKALREIRVAEAMTTDVYACNPRDEVTEAEAIMQEVGVRRLPVIDELDRVIGVLSLADLAREAAWQNGLKHPQITYSEVGQVLSAICRVVGATCRESEKSSQQARP